MRQLNSGTESVNIERVALARVGRIFKIDIDKISLDAKFGKDLKSSFASDFKFNELDKIDQDIRDVADRKILKQLSEGSLVILTVQDYCDHMVRCYASKPAEVIYVLKL